MTRNEWLSFLWTAISAAPLTFMAVFIAWSVWDFFHGKDGRR